MDAIPVFIGDEIGSAGFRLAGARVVVPPPGQERQALEEARRDAALVVLSAEVALRLPADALADAAAALQPLVLIAPDTQGRCPRPDVADRLRHQLGLAT